MSAKNGLTDVDKKDKAHTKGFLYFAYGSNMNPQRMKDREVEYHKRELAELPGFLFLMNKFIKSNGTAAANIKEDPKSSVYGALYTCSSEEAFTKLDKFEGVRTYQYYRKTVSVYLTNGDTRRAEVYIAHDHSCKDNLKINPAYLKHILEGYDILPTDYFTYLKSFQANLVEGKN